MWPLCDILWWLINVNSNNDSDTDNDGEITDHDNDSKNGNDGYMISMWRLFYGYMMVNNG